MAARAALLIRVAVALLTRTFFQPDEYYQSLEPAHHIVFGYGALTWEWFTSIRSVLYPALNVPVYALLKATSLAETSVLGDWLLVGMSQALLRDPRKQCCGG
jgi:phosphatidylinositol glycan class B